jgi:hypothetical protein
MYRRKFFVGDLPPHYTTVAVVSSMNDIPEDLSKEIFIVNRGGRDRWVVLACPCGCKDRLDVNLMSTRRPFWRLRRHRGTVSLLPSLWVSEDRCGSHFWLVRNRVVWARAESRSAQRQTLVERVRAKFKWV